MGGTCQSNHAEYPVCGDIGCGELPNIGPDRCNASSCDNPAARNVNADHVFTMRPDDEVELALPILPMNFDFERPHVMPGGWRKTAESPPSGFLFAGGDACVIEGNDGGTRPTRHVLLALPGWAVEFRRAQWLARLQGRPENDTRLCRLCRVFQVEMGDVVVFEFEHPCREGGNNIKALSQWLERCTNGYMGEADGQVLCLDLLQLLTGLQSTPMRLWGFADASMVFLGGGGRLGRLLPIGCLLTLAGAKAVAAKLIEEADSNSQNAPRGITPELAAVLSSGRVFADDAHKITSDTYAVVALVLEAMLQTGPEGIRDCKVTTALSESANDFFHKALYEDPEWRLCGEQALAHPWLRRAVDGTTSSTLRRSSKSK